MVGSLKAIPPRGTEDDRLDCDRRRQRGGTKAPLQCNRFADLWENRDGTAIYARLISDARVLFIQYLDIPTRLHRNLINPSAGFVVDINSEAYEVMLYMRLNEWGKNRFSLFAQAATVLQKELEATHHWGGLARAKLISAYSSWGTSLSGAFAQPTSKIDHHPKTIEKNKIALMSALSGASSRRIRALLIFRVVVEN